MNDLNLLPKLVPRFKKGYKIKIKKQNKGKFTDYCGGKVTDECIQKGKNSSDPKIRKRATFAANARTWKHQQGGLLKKALEEYNKHVESDKYWKNDNGQLYFYPKPQINNPYVEDMLTTDSNVYKGNYPDRYSVTIHTIPEVVAARPVRLNTYYPFISMYPFTGHSELIMDNNYGIPLKISKGGDDPNYNLVTNNCADATMRALRYGANQDGNIKGITTPGDSLEYAKEHYRYVNKGTKDGVNTIVILPTIEQGDRLKTAMTKYNINRDKYKK